MQVHIHTHTNTHTQTHTHTHTHTHTQTHTNPAQNGERNYRIIGVLSIYSKLLKISWISRTLHTFKTFFPNNKLFTAEISFSYSYAWKFKKSIRFDYIPYDLIISKLMHPAKRHQSKKN